MAFVMSVHPFGGHSATEYKHMSNTFIEGRIGSWYEIQLYNDNTFPITATFSVDGRSVLTMESASIDSPAHVLTPKSHIRIKGWKDSEDKFYFSQSSFMNNAGVIGCAIKKLELVNSNNQVGKGEFYHLPVNGKFETYAVSNDNPVIMSIYYNTLDNLKKMGVPVGSIGPNPFPTSPYVITSSLPSNWRYK